MVDATAVGKTATEILSMALDVLKTLDPAIAPMIVAGMVVLQKIAGNKVPTAEDLAALCNAREAKVAAEGDVFDKAAAQGS